MNRNLHLYTVMPLIEEHIEELCEDIKEQVESGVATCAIFKMSLVPEGTPVINKAEKLCKIYKSFKKRLDDFGIRNGVLVQCSIGHDYVLTEMFPYQRYVNFRDGDARNVVCPFDEGFQNYIRNALEQIAACHPDCIMVDDDLRLIFRSGGGCGCPLHMERFSQLSGVNISREELWKIVTSNDEKSKEFTNIMVQTQREAVVAAAKAMREGIDAVDPKIPGSFCCCGNNVEFATEIATVLAGKNNPLVVRINNGRYLNSNPREFSSVFFRAAQSKTILEDKVDFVLAETDTCPQNRYSMSAIALHAHFTGCLLEGLSGAKHWLTRLPSYEPESGIAYRKILSKNRNFYEKLAEIVPSLKWRGCRIPLATEPNFQFGKGQYDVTIEQDGWGSNVLERMGVPMFFGAKNGGIVCFEGEKDSYYTNEELLEFFKGPVVLASDAAERLIKRGFSEYIGVDVRSWQGKTPIGEVLPNGLTNSQYKIKELVPLTEKTKTESFAYYSRDRHEKELLFPSVTTYKNELGGTVAVFAGTPAAPFDLGGIFAFLTQTRKKQFVDLFSRMGELPIYCDGDNEIYLRVADMPNDETFCAVFNLGLDEIENLKFVLERDVEFVERLMPDGTRQKIDFFKNGNTVTLSCGAKTLDPVVLFLK